MGLQCGKGNKATNKEATCCQRKQGCTLKNNWQIRNRFQSHKTCTRTCFRSFVCSCFCAFVRSFVRSFIGSFVRSFGYLAVCWASDHPSRISPGPPSDLRYHRRHPQRYSGLSKHPKYVVCKYHHPGLSRHSFFLHSIGFFFYRLIFPSQNKAAK